MYVCMYSMYIYMYVCIVDPFRILVCMYVCAAAWRCAALFEEEDNKMAIEFMEMSLACDPGNLLSRQTIAILHIRFI